LWSPYLALILAVLRRQNRHNPAGRAFSMPEILFGVAREAFRTAYLLVVPGDFDLRTVGGTFTLGAFTFSPLGTPLFTPPAFPLFGVL
jgi:hypothetical protein